jgi:hypothetical protein
MLWKKRLPVAAAFVVVPVWGRLFCFKEDEYVQEVNLFYGGGAVVRGVVPVRLPD